MNIDGKKQHQRFVKFDGINNSFKFNGEPKRHNVEIKRSIFETKKYNDNNDEDHNNFQAKKELFEKTSYKTLMSNNAVFKMPTTSTTTTPPSSIILPRYYGNLINLIFEYQYYQQHYSQHFSKRAIAMFNKQMKTPPQQHDTIDEDLYYDSVTWSEFHYELTKKFNFERYMVPNDSIPSTLHAALNRLKKNLNDVYFNCEIWKRCIVEVYNLYDEANRKYDGNKMKRLDLMIRDLFVDSGFSRTVYNHDLFPAYRKQGFLYSHPNQLEPYAIDDEHRQLLFDYNVKRYEQFAIATMIAQYNNFIHYLCHYTLFIETKVNDVMNVYQHSIRKHGTTARDERDNNIISLCRRTVYVRLSIQLRILQECYQYFKNTCEKLDEINVGIENYDNAPIIKYVNRKMMPDLYPGQTKQLLKVFVTGDNAVRYGDLMPTPPSTTTMTTTTTTATTLQPQLTQKAVTLPRPWKRPTLNFNIQQQQFNINNSSSGSCNNINSYWWDKINVEESTTTTTNNNVCFLNDGVINEIWNCPTVPSFKLNHFDDSFDSNGVIVDDEYNDENDNNDCYENGNTSSNSSSIDSCDYLHYSNNTNVTELEKQERLKREEFKLAEQRRDLLNEQIQTNSYVQVYGEGLNRIKIYTHTLANLPIAETPNNHHLRCLNNLYDLCDTMIYLKYSFLDFIDDLKHKHQYWRLVSTNGTLRKFIDVRSLQVKDVETAIMYFDRLFEGQFEQRFKNARYIKNFQNDLDQDCNLILPNGKNLSISINTLSVTRNDPEENKAMLDLLAKYNGMMKQLHVFAYTIYNIINHFYEDGMFVGETVARSHFDNETAMHNIIFKSEDFFLFYLKRTYVDRLPKRAINCDNNNNSDTNAPMSILNSPSTCKAFNQCINRVTNNFKKIISESPRNICNRLYNIQSNQQMYKMF